MSGTSTGSCDFPCDATATTGADSRRLGGWAAATSSTETRARCICAATCRVGAWLSAGIDSSAVTSADVQGHRATAGVHLLRSRFENPRFDELRQNRILDDYPGIRACRSPDCLPPRDIARLPRRSGTRKTRGWSALEIAAPRCLDAERRPRTSRSCSPAKAPTRSSAAIPGSGRTAARSGDPAAARHPVVGWSRTCPRSRAARRGRARIARRTRADGLGALFAPHHRHRGRRLRRQRTAVAVGCARRSAQEADDARCARRPRASTAGTRSPASSTSSHAPDARRRRAALDRARWPRRSRCACRSSITSWWSSARASRPR